MRQVIAENMADGYNPPEYSPIKEVRRRQRTPTHPYLQDIHVTYDSIRGDYQVKHARVVALRIKSQNGETYTVALNQNGGRY